RIDRNAGAAQIVDIRDAVSEYRERRSGGEMGIGTCIVGEKAVTVIGLGCADIHTDICSRDRGWADACIFERLPGQLQKDPLLRIHLLGLARRDAKDAWIEAPQIVNNTGSPGIAFAGFLTTRVPKSFERESIGRNARYRAAPFQKHGPKLSRRPSARQPARPPDDRDLIP